MNYYFRELLRGNRTFWLAVLVFSIWAVAVVDLVSSAFKGEWFRYTLILTFASPIIYYVYRLLADKKEASKKQDMKDFSSWYEPQQEKKIREMVEADPGFFTHCFECIHFDERLSDCSKKLSNDIRVSHIKEIKINNKTYCLYWEVPGKNRIAS